MWNGLITAMISARNFVGLVLKKRLKLKRNRLQSTYMVNGHTYTIFRETIRRDSTGAPVVLVVGFRLKLLGSQPLLHWLFQRICIVTTPFWSGLSGFKVKLWMVDSITKNYLGIYDWRSKQGAQSYIDFLLPILNFFSVKDSVHAKQIHNTDLENYLKSRQQP